MAKDYRGIIELEDAADRAAFIAKAIDSYHDTRTQSPEVMRHIGATAYVGSELSQADRRGLTGEERGAVEGAAADKLRRRFGGS